jgi:hypothetical protein
MTERNSPGKASHNAHSARSGKLMAPSPYLGAAAAGPGPARQLTQDGKDAISHARTHPDPGRDEGRPGPLAGDAQAADTRSSESGSGLIGGYGGLGHSSPYVRPLVRASPLPARSGHSNP